MTAGGGQKKIHLKYQTGVWRITLPIRQGMPMTVSQPPSLWTPTNEGQLTFSSENHEKVLTYIDRVPKIQKLNTLCPEISK